MNPRCGRYELRVPPTTISASRLSTWWSIAARTRSVACAFMLSLAIPPAGVAAESNSTALDELVPPLSLGVSRLDNVTLQDPEFSSSPPDNRGQRGFSPDDVLNPIPRSSSITLQPTDDRRTGGTYKAVVKFKPILVVQS